MRGDRRVVPQALRKIVIEDLHSAHQGVKSTLRRAREYIYWPGMKSEISDHISHCEACASYGPKQQKEPLISHEVPDRPWAKIATDLFELKKKEYLVTVDYYSGFFEVDRLTTTTSQAVIRKLKAHLARYGVPDEIVSDNGPHFISKEFKTFQRNYGFTHTRTSPHYHQSNGKVEAAVKQAKKILRMAHATGEDPFLALLATRNTPQEDLESSPAQRLMSRRTKTTLPTASRLLKPHVEERVLEKIGKRQKRQQKQYNKGARELKPLHEGDTVKIQPVHLGQKEWTSAQVLKQVGIRSYEVEANGRNLIRNRRHLKKFEGGEADPSSSMDPTQTTPNQAPQQAEQTTGSTPGSMPGSTTPGPSPKEPHRPKISATEANAPTDPSPSPRRLFMKDKQGEEQVQTRSRSGRLLVKPVYLKEYVTN